MAMFIEFEEKPTLLVGTPNICSKEIEIVRGTREIQLKVQASVNIFYYKIARVSKAVLFKNI